MARSSGFRTALRRLTRFLAPVPLLLPLALGTLLATGEARAQRFDPKCIGGVLSLYVENDLFFHTDRNYTSGVKLAWVSPDLDSYDRDACLPDWVKPMNERVRNMFGFSSIGAHERNMVITLGQEIYTPGDRARRDLILDDRPYAGWLHLGLGYNERRRPADSGIERLDSLEVNLGVVGPLALARFSQNLIHDLRGFERWDGWANQLRNEPGVQVIAERKFKGLYERRKVDAIGHYGVSLGNVATHLNAGMEVRFGTDIPDDFGSSPVRPAGNNSAPGVYRRDVSGRRGIHAFAAFDLRAVARNIFLDGNSFRSSHSVTKEPLVADIALGVAAFAGAWKFSFGRVIRSKEFAGQTSRHAYGSFTLSRDFD